MTETTNLGVLTKRWAVRAEQLTVASIKAGGTMRGQFLTAQDRGIHLLQKSLVVRPWTEQEERRWMQLVGSVFPVNTYLFRIDKHPTGACPFGCRDAAGVPVRETIMHFQ